MSTERVRPHILIRPIGRLSPIRLSELWEFRDLLVRFAARDITLRYRQTVLGVGWVVLQPLLSAAVLAFVFSRVAGLSSGDVPYFAFAYAGMVGWTLFNSTVTKFTGSLLQSTNLVSKVFFPRLLLPISTLGSSFIDLGVGLAILVVVLMITGVTPGLALLTLPLWILLTLLLGGGVGLMGAALVVPYRDINNLITFVMQMALYASPVAYGLSTLSPSTRRVVELNPASGLFEGFRWALIDTPAPSVGLVTWTVIAAVLSFVAGTLVFARLDRRFADVI